jgi:hypothetical protein
LIRSNGAGANTSQVDIPHKSIDKSFGVEERKSDHFVHLSSELLLYFFSPPNPTRVFTSFRQAVQAGWFSFYLTSLKSHVSDTTNAVTKASLILRPDDRTLQLTYGR